MKSQYERFEELADALSASVGGARFCDRSGPAWTWPSVSYDWLLAHLAYAPMP